jgi:hypothetical protein
MQRSDVFISYRRKDVDFTKQLDEALKKTGREVWVDWEDIPPGVEGFADEIQQGVEGADAFIAVLSPEYLESEYCTLELKEAVRLNKRIVPLVLEKIEIAPAGIGHINWIYFTPHAGQENTFDESFPKVIQALEADNEHTRQHTAFLVRARDWEKKEKNPSYLLKGKEIEAAEHWLAAAVSKNPIPAELHSRYILASRQQQRKQQQQFMAVIGLLMVIAAIAAIFAVRAAIDADVQRNLAVDAQVDAQTQAANAQDSQAQAQTQAANAQNSQAEAEYQAYLAGIAQDNAEIEATNASIAQNEAEEQAQVSRSLALSASALEPANAHIAVALALEAVNMTEPPQQSIINLYNIGYRPGIRRSFQLDDSTYANNVYNLVHFRQAAVSPDETSMVVQNRLISLEDGRVLQTFENAPVLVLAAAFSPDGTRVALAGDTPSYLADEVTTYLGIWDVQTGRLLQEFATGAGVVRVQISADGTTLASFEAQDRIRWWDIATGREKNTFGSYPQATFSSDFSQIAYIRNSNQASQGDYTTNFTIDVLSTGDRSNIARISVKSNTAPRLQFNDDATELVVIYDEFFEIYSLLEDSAGNFLMGYNGHRANISSIDVGANSIISTGGDTKLIKWQRDSGLISYTLSGHTVPVVFTHFLNNETQAVSIDIVGRVNIWDLYEGDLIQLNTEDCEPNCTNSTELYYNQDESIVAFVSAEEAAIIVDDILQETELARFPIPEDSFVWGGVTFVEGDSAIVFDLYDANRNSDQVIMLNLETGRTTILIDELYVSAFRYLPSENLFIIGTERGLLSYNFETQLLDNITGQYVYNVEYYEVLQSVYVVADNGTFAYFPATKERFEISDTYGYELVYLETPQMIMANTDSGLILFNPRSKERIHLSETYAYQHLYFEAEQFILATTDTSTFAYNPLTAERILIDEAYAYQMEYIESANIVLINTDNSLLAFNLANLKISTLFPSYTPFWHSDVDHLLIASTTDPDGGNSLLVGFSMPDMTERFSVPADYATHVWFLSDTGIFISAENISNWESKILSRDLQTGEVISPIIPSIPYADVLELSPDGSFLVVAAETVYSGIETTVSEIPLDFEYPTRYLQLWDFENHTLIRNYPSSAFNVEFSEDGRSFLAESFTYSENNYGNTSTTWRLDTLEELIDWVCKNRYVADFADFTPEQREGYGITSESNLCER